MEQKESNFIQDIDGKKKAILKDVSHGLSGYNVEDGEYDKIIIKNKQHEEN